MLRFLLRRTVLGVVSLFVFITFLFFLVSALVPGDWTSQFLLTAEQRAQLQSELGLDLPLWRQYAVWLGSLAQANLGISYTGFPVSDLIAVALPRTLLVLLLGVGTATVLGFWVGRRVGYRKHGFATRLQVTLAVVALTVFPPFLAFGLERTVQNLFGFFALQSLREQARDLLIERDLSEQGVLWGILVGVGLGLAVMTLFAWLIRRLRRTRLSPGIWFAGGLAVACGLVLIFNRFNVASALLAMSGLLILGVLILTFGEIVLITQATMEGILLEDYVMVARAKGLPERDVRDHHAARAALLPLLSRMVVAVPYFMTGLVVLEAVFLNRGLGFLLFEAVRDQDLPTIVGTLVVVGALTLILRLGLEVAHAALDPRSGAPQMTDHQ